MKMFPVNRPVVRGFLHQTLNVRVFILVPTSKHIAQELKSPFVSQRNYQGKEGV